MEVSVVAGVDPDRARESAQHILDDRRFHSDPAPRPLRGPLEWLGDRLSSIGRWFGDRFKWVPWWMRYVIAIAVMAAVVALIVHLVRRRAKRPTRPTMRAAAVAPTTAEDPATLEREADAAERDGDFDRAIRLRFRAGLLRLGRRGAIAYRSSVTTGEVRRALRSETFDGLAGTFERVAYGGREALRPDAEASRRDWPRVLETSGSGKR